MIRTSLTPSPANSAPPAPVVSDLIIGDLAGSLHPARYAGLIDTGADRTVVPLKACQDLSLTPRDWKSPGGFDPKARTRKIPLYYVNVKLEGVAELPLLVYAIEQDTILLGRDFLTGIVFVSDSPQNELVLGRHGALSKWILRFVPFR